jgi:hypothetical protein
MSLLSGVAEGRNMDGGQFDDISRKLASRTTRRDAVRKGGIMAAVAGALGIRSIAHAQDDDDPAETFDCDWGFKALIIEGPNKDATFEGLMKVAIERDGAIDDGTLETEEPEPYRVVGNTRGKVLSLRITISNDEELACTGVGSRDIKSCQGRISGTLAGPEFGDIGVWEIVRRVQPGGGSGNGTAVASATAGSGGGNPQPTPGGGNPNPTSTPGASSTTCPPEDCGVTKMWDPQQCKCVCYDNGVDCGPDTCCPQGAICGSGGGCSCPPGTVICGNACVSECAPGSHLDYNTCTCVQGCGPGQVECNGNCVDQCDQDHVMNTSTCQCVSICGTGGKVCGGVCKDVTNDILNCGSCGNSCPLGQPCIAGTCKCPPGMDYYCTSSFKCAASQNDC